MNINKLPFHLGALAAGAAIVIAASLLSGCAQKSTGPQPPDILYGQEMCAQCGMIISDARFAAATLLTSGEFLKFDDAGEMIHYHIDHPEAQVNAWFVHDYTTEAWIRGEDAYFVMSTQIETPMGTSIVSFTSKQEAEAFSEENLGIVYSLDEIRVHVHSEVHGN